MKNKIVIIAALIYLINLPLFASELEYNGSVYKGSLHLNGNLHSSDFTQLPGIDNLCPGFESAFGLGMGAYVGYEKRIVFPILGNMNGSYSLSLGYSSIGADFLVEEYFTNVIYDDYYEKGYVEHTLETTINVLTFEPALWLQPLADLPLQVKLGTTVAMPISATYYQSEDLTGPEGATLQNGKTYQNRQEGDIPDVNSLMLAIGTGLRYEVYRWGQFRLVPEVNFNYYFSNINSSLEWKPMTVSAGISIEYHDTKPVIAAPMPAPAPPMPAPPLSAGLEFALDIQSGNQPLNDGDTVKIPIYKTMYANEYSFVPVIFYSPDTDKPVTETGPGYAEKLLLESRNMAAEYMQQHPEVRLKLMSVTVDSEKQDLDRKRVGELKQYMIDNGIDESRISAEYFTVQEKKLKYAELAADNCYIRFDFSGGNQMLSVISDISYTSKPGNLDIQLKPVIDGAVPPVTMAGKVANHGRDIYDIDARQPGFRLGKQTGIDPEEINEITLKMSAKDALGREKSDKRNFIIAPRPIVTDTVLNREQAGGKQYRQYVVGYCQYDRSALFATNPDSKARVHNALKNGQRVEVLPLYDAFGTEDHNDRLARNRANNALDYLDISENEVTVMIPKDYLHDNGTAYGRMLNRAVVVRIYE